MQDYKFHAARYNEIDQPLDIFLRDRDEWDSWNSWQGTKNEFNRDYVVSFIKFYPEQETWLFGGIYKILGRRSEKRTNSYDIELTDKGRYLIGRLKITATLSRGRPFKTDGRTIIQRENFWKEALLTRGKQGYNGN